MLRRDIPVVLWAPHASAIQVAEALRGASVLMTHSDGHRLIIPNKAPGEADAKLLETIGATFRTAGPLALRSGTFSPR